MADAWFVGMCWLVFLLGDHCCFAFVWGVSLGILCFEASRGYVFLSVLLGLVRFLRLFGVVSPGGPGSYRAFGLRLFFKRVAWCDQVPAVVRGCIARGAGLLQGVCATCFGWFVGFG